VVTIWECALNTAAAREWLALRLPTLLGTPASPATALTKVAEDETPYRVPR